MTCGDYSFLFLDACFIDRLKRIDKSCELLDLFGPCANAVCVIKKDQYIIAPCDDFIPDCIDLDDIFSDEDAIMAHREIRKIGIDFTRIARDPSDIKAFIWAYKTDRAAIWTCDKNFLDLCRIHNIPRYCFKAAIKALDYWLKGAISDDDQYNTSDMQVGDDPFYHYNNNNRCQYSKRCQPYCGLISSCVCFKEFEGIL